MRAALRTHGALLAAGAVTAGLGAVRPRSAPARVSSEAESFVRLCLAAAGAEAGGSELLDAAVGAEVRQGCFAGASAAETADVFRLWRRALAAFLAGIPEGGVAGDALLASLEERVERERARWERQRIDLVAIGASAGGIEALAELLSTLGTELPASIVCVLHLASRGPTLLPAILSRRAGLAVAAASDGAMLCLEYVYVAPPGRHLLVEGPRLRLVDGPPVHFVKPSADVLLESAAASFGRRVASVILSGSGSDGAAGTRAIHEHGGLTIVQDPREAEFASMPEAAIATGHADRVAALSAMGRLIRSAVLRGREAVA